MSFILRTLGMGGGSTSTASPTSTSATNKRKSLAIVTPTSTEANNAQQQKTEPIRYKITKEQFDEFIKSKTGEFMDSKMKECLLAIAEALPMEPLYFLRQFWETQVKQFNESLTSTGSSTQLLEPSSPKSPNYLDLKDEALELQKQLLEWNMLSKKLEEEEIPNLISKLEEEKLNASQRTPATEQQLLLDQSHLQELDLQAESLEQEYAILQKSHPNSPLEQLLQEWKSMQELVANGTALESQIQTLSLLKQLQVRLQEEQDELDHQLLQLNKLYLV